MNWPSLILATNFAWGMFRANHKINVLSVYSEQISEQGRLPKELGDELVEVMGTMRWAELRSEMADTGVKVGTNAGNVNVPEDVPKTLNLCQQYSFHQLMWSSLAAWH